MGQTAGLARGMVGRSEKVTPKAAASSTASTCSASSAVLVDTDEEEPPPGRTVVRVSANTLSLPVGALPGAADGCTSARSSNRSSSCASEDASANDVPPSPNIIQVRRYSRSSNLSNQSQATEDAQRARSSLRFQPIPSKRGMSKESASCPRPADGGLPMVHSPSTRRFLVEALEKHFVFGSLEEHEREHISNELRSTSFAVNEVVVEQGDVGNSCFFIRSGEFTVHIDGQYLKALGPKQSFGELALLYHMKRTATVKCSSPGELFEMDNACFRRCMNGLHTKIADKALEFFRSDSNFCGLNEEDQKLLAGACSMQTFQDGGVILRQGEVGEWLLMVLSGKVCEQTGDGGADAQATLTLGAIIGSVGLIYGKRQAAGARADGEVSCLALGKTALERLPNSVHDVVRRCAVESMLMSSSRRGEDDSDLFNLLTAEQKHRVVAAAEDGYFASREIIVAPSDPAQLLLVVDGEVAVLPSLSVTDFHEQDGSAFCKPSVDIEKCAESFVSEGMGYGEQELRDAAPMARFVVAVSAVRLHRITHESVRKVLGEPLAEVVQRAQIKKVLSDIFLFKNLREEQIDRLVRNLEQHSFEAGEIIVQQDDPARHFFLIQSGTISVQKRSRVLRQLGRWDYFGERGLLMNEKRSATCQATEPCVCLVLDADVFFEIVGMFRKELERRMHLQDLNITMEELKCKAVIGRGTFGVVRLVSPINDPQKDYALKGVKKLQVVRNRQEESIVMEREVNAQCFHPCIVQFIKTFQDVHNVYFLTEFLGGGDLFMAIRQIGALTKEQSSFFSGSIILAIEYLHGRMIMYRDLKPENVLLDFQGCAKLVDFGCCKKELRTSTLCGTPEYIAPEVIACAGYTCSVDWWSLGVIVHEFIVGPLPFGSNAEDQMTLFKAILEEPLEIPSYVDDEDAVSILHALLDRRSAYRLGASARGAKDIKDHPYFAEFNWDALAGGFYEPPWKPDAEEIMKSWEAPDDLMGEISKGSVKVTKGMEWAKVF